MANSATINSAEQLAPSTHDALRAAPRTAVAGVGGYAGAELARLLLHHPRFAGTAPTFLGRAGEADVARPISLEDIHPQLATPGQKHEVVPFTWQRLLDSGIEALFLATPHEQSREWVPQAIQHGMKVIDRVATLEGGDRIVLLIDPTELLDSTERQMLIALRNRASDKS